MSGLGRLLFIIRALSVFELAVPESFNLVDLLGAEVAPLCNFLLSLGVPLKLLISVGILLIELLLSDVSQFKRNLCDLAHIGGLTLVAAWEFELLIRELLQDEFLQD